MHTLYFDINDCSTIAMLTLCYVFGSLDTGQGKNNPIIFSDSI